MIFLFVLDIDYFMINKIYKFTYETLDKMIHNLEFINNNYFINRDKHIKIYIYNKYNVYKIILTYYRLIYSMY